jgi:hypothetical protein
MRTTAERRHKTITKQKRKMEIVKETFNVHFVDTLLHDKIFVGKLKKGKVHCSCPICSSKTKTHGMKHSEKKKAVNIEEY